MKLLVPISLLLTCSECFAQGNDSNAKVDFNPMLIKQDSTYKKNISSVKTTDLKTVIVESKLLQFQRDSLENRLLYHKIISDAQPNKTKLFVRPGELGVKWSLSKIILGVSGKSKRNKLFVRNLEKNEREEFLAIIYNTERIKSVGKTDDSIASLFMEQYPIPYDFARAASPLEVDMWIRDNYREFEKNCLVHE